MSASAKPERSDPRSNPHASGSSLNRSFSGDFDRKNAWRTRNVVLERRRVFCAYSSRLRTKLESGRAKVEKFHRVLDLAEEGFAVLVK